MMHERHNALCPQQWLQAFVVDDSEATTDEEDTAPSTSAAQASQEIPEGASSTEAERHAVLERLQGQDNPLAAGFKVRHGPLDPLLVTCWQACFGALTPAYHVPGRLTHSENILRQGSNLQADSCCMCLIQLPATPDPGQADRHGAGRGSGPGRQPFWEGAHSWPPGGRQGVSQLNRISRSTFCCTLAFERTSDS